MRRNFLPTSIIFATSVVAITSIGLIQSCYAEDVKCHCQVAFGPGKGPNQASTGILYQYTHAKTFTGPNAMENCKKSKLFGKDSCEGQCKNRKGHGYGQGGEFTGEWTCDLK